MPVCLSFLIVLFWSILTLALLKPCHCFLKSIQYCAALVILKRCETDHIAFLFQSLHWLPITQIIKYKINTPSAINVSNALLCLISVTVLNSTHPLILSALFLILSASRFLVPDFPLLSFSIFGPVHGMTFPFLSRRKPLWTHSNPSLKHFPKEQPCHVFPAVLLSSSPCLFSVF